MCPIALQYIFRTHEDGCPYFYATGLCIFSIKDPLTHCEVIYRIVGVWMIEMQVKKSYSH